MTTSVRVEGLADALAFLRTLREGAAAAGAWQAAIGSDLPYAYGQNYGRYRSGRLARRAGPTLFLEAGARVIEESAVDGLAPALPKGPAAVTRAIAVIERRAAEAARRRAPILGGALRASVRAIGRPR